jgi:hypothetical protein
MTRIEVMKLKAIAVLGLLLALAGAAAAQTAQTTRAELPAPDNFLGIATFPLWEGDAPGALGKALMEGALKPVTRSSARAAAPTSSFWAIRG